MQLAQHILVYLTLAIAVGYLVKKFLLPRSLFPSGKNKGKNCGSDGCGCG